MTLPVTMFTSQSLLQSRRKSDNVWMNSLTKWSELKKKIHIESGFKFSNLESCLLGKDLKDNTSPQYYRSFVQIPPVQRCIKKNINSNFTKGLNAKSPFSKQNLRNSMKLTCNTHERSQIFCLQQIVFIQAHPKYKGLPRTTN